MVRIITDEASYQDAIASLREMLKYPEGSRQDEEGARLLTLIERWETEQAGQSLQRIFSKEGDSFMTIIPCRPSWA